MAAPIILSDVPLTLDTHLFSAAVQAVHAALLKHRGRVTMAEGGKWEVEALRQPESVGGPFRDPHEPVAESSETHAQIVLALHSDNEANREYAVQVLASLARSLAASGRLKAVGDVEHTDHENGIYVWTWQIEAGS